MCGIVGVLGYPISEESLRAFHTLFYLNELRGGDGIGLLNVKNTTVMGTPTSVYTTLKDHEMTAEMAQTYSDEYDKMTKFDHANRLILAHCRAATIGKVTTENNHPIILEDLIGVHNGTIKLPKYNTEGKTDSQVLYETIESLGWPEVYEEIKEEPYALVWVDKVKNTLSLTRSKDRPLCIMKLEGDTLFFASDWKMLDFIRRYHGLRVMQKGLFEVMPGELVQFNLRAHQVTTPMYVGPSVPAVEEKKVG